MWSKTHFTQEQRAVIESFGQGQAVIAGAGCGKTTTLVAKCHALIQKNPKARFVAVSFTERSASDLKEKLARLSLPRGFSCCPVLIHINGVHENITERNFLK